MNWWSGTNSSGEPTLLEEPEKYETYADIGMGEWIHMRLQVKGSEARLFINDLREPSLIVTDLKLGPELRGGVGYWIESGTVGYFRNLQVSHGAA